MLAKTANKMLAFMLMFLLCLLPLQLCFADEGEEPEPEPEPELVVVPGVAGMTREQAEQTLRDAGFSVSFVPTDKEDMDKGVTSVEYTDPSGGSEVEPGSTITVYVFVGTKEKKEDEGDDEGDEGDDSGEEGDDSGDSGDEGDGDDEGDDSGDEGDGDDEGDDPVDPDDDSDKPAADQGDKKKDKDKKDNKPGKSKEKKKKKREKKPARTRTVVHAQKISNATWGYYSGTRQVRTEPIEGNLPYSVTHKSEDASTSALPENVAAYEISKALEEDPAKQDSSRMALTIVTALSIAALILGFLYRMTMHSLLMKGGQSAAKKRRALLKGRR